MSCCGIPTPRKSDEPEYAMAPELALLVGSWEGSCPGITRAVHEEIATGDWDRQEEGFVPPYETTQAFAAALRVLEATLLARHILRQHQKGPWYVRWGLAQPSKDLPSADLDFLAAARQDVANTLAYLDMAAARTPAQGAPVFAQAHGWGNPQVSMTWQDGVSARIGASHP